MQESWSLGFLVPKHYLKAIYFVTSRQYWLLAQKCLQRSTINPSTKLIWNFKNFLLNRIFYWLPDLLASLTNAFRLDNGYSYRLDFFTVLCPEMYLFTNRSSFNACIMVLLKFIFVLLCAPFLSRLPCRWQGTFYTILHFEYYPNCSK